MPHLIVALAATATSFAVPAGIAQAATTIGEGGSPTKTIQVQIDSSVSKNLNVIRITDDTVSFDFQTPGLVFQGGLKDIDGPGGCSISPVYPHSSAQCSLAAVSLIDIYGGDETDYITVLPNNWATGGQQPIPPLVSIRGQGGDDYIFGSPSDDYRLDGGPGNDEIKGSSGDDNIFGRSGNDTFWGGSGRDSIDGGGDRGDTVSYTDHAGGVQVTLDNFANDGNASEDGAEDNVRNVANVTGTSHNDVLLGNASPNTLNGGDGQDSINGGGGGDMLLGGPGPLDLLVGGEGNDAMLGGPGDDYLFGGPGNDVMVDSFWGYPGGGTNLLYGSDDGAQPQVDTIGCTGQSIDNVFANQSDNVVNEMLCNSVVRN